jgi:hypothetical protein
MIVPTNTCPQSLVDPVPWFQEFGWLPGCVDSAVSFWALMTITAGVLAFVLAWVAAGIWVYGFKDRADVRARRRARKEMWRAYRARQKEARRASTTNREGVSA